MDVVECTRSSEMKLARHLKDEFVSNAVQRPFFVKHTLRNNVVDIDWQCAVIIKK